MRFAVLTLLTGLILLLTPASSPRAESARAVEAKRRIEAMRDEIDDLRGLAWKRPVGIRVLDREAMRKALVESAKTMLPAEFLERMGKAYRRWGLLPADTDPLEVILSLVSDGAAGCYDPERGEILIREKGGGYTLGAVLAHELAHALDDQHHDLLGRTRALMYDADRTFAEHCLFEGIAECVRVRYEQAHPEDAPRPPEDPEKARKDWVTMLTTTPSAFVAPLLLHYVVGPRLVQRATADGLEKAEALIADPPISQEQYLHPEKWFSRRRDWPRSVVWAGDLALAAGLGWKIVVDLRLGELDLALYVDAHTDKFRRGPYLRTANLRRTPPVAPYSAGVARGWDAGRAVFLEKEGQPIGVVEAWAFDTRRDAVQAVHALFSATGNRHRDGGEFKAGKWAPTPPGQADPATDATIDYVGAFGAARMMLRGDHVLVADGFEPEVLESVWRWVLGTRFLRDERDIGGEREVEEK